MSVEVSISLALAGFSLQAEFTSGNGVTALFGPSGAGKTMTLRCIAGLTRPSGGSIKLNATTLFDSEASIDVPPRHRRVGYVFQEYALFPHLSVSRNVAYGIHGLPARARAERVRELLDLVGLAGLEERAPAQLSGGQQQRVALARALAPEPRLLLLDEPFAAVDLRVRRRLREEIRRVHEMTRTPMLLVTHDLAEVRELADSIVLVDRGRTLRHDSLERLLGPPPDPLVAELLGYEA